MTGYTRLSSEEREQIHRALAQNKGCNEIARQIGRNPSTVSREIGRLGLLQTYSPILAQADSEKKKASRRAEKRKIKGVLAEAIEEYLLHKRFSPEQISHCLRKQFPLNYSMHASHETIYQYIYQHKDPYKKRQLIQCLRRRKKHRRRKKKERDKRGVIPNMKSIHERPKEATLREEMGHWEGDLVVGKDHKSAILTLVDRKSRFVIIEPLTDGLGSEATIQSCINGLCNLPPELRKTLTYDRGKEMSFHEQLTEAIGIKVYFADPHAPWQRGTNENTNGLIREFFPKGTDFSLCSRQEIKKVEFLLNSRPRKVLQFGVPMELMHNRMCTAVRFL